MNRAALIEQQRQRHYKSAMSIFRAALKSYRKDLNAQLRNCSTFAEMQVAASKILQPAPIEDAMRKVYAKVGKEFGEQTRRELAPLKKAGRFTQRERQIHEDYWFSWADKNVRGNLGKRITWITGTTSDVFISTVDKVAIKGFEKGLSIGKIADAIMSELNFAERYRAERIARTEVIGASNSASHAVAQETGLLLQKQWLSKIDDRTRDSHIDMDGETVDMDESFSNGLNYPGDPNGEAGDVINCRCTQVYMAKEGAEYAWGREPINTD